jgi:membrane dipeptidase
MELVRGIQRKYFLQMPKVDYRKLLDHIDHIARVAGADHVGLGSDFDGISGMAPAGMEDVSRYPTRGRGLMERGYSDADIRKIMGLNILRVFRACGEGAEQR